MQQVISGNPYTIAVVTEATESATESTTEHTTPVPHVHTWDDIPVDNRVMIWRDFNEQIRAERYSARLLRFQYFGREIALADRMELLLGAQAWVHGQSGEDEIATEQLEAVESRLQIRVRRVFDALFRPLQQDVLNLNAQAWTQIAFRIQNVTADRETRVSDVMYGDIVFHVDSVIYATSADGLHRVRLNVSREAEDDSAAINIRYVGPQRFNTFNNWNHVQQSGGDLREFAAHPEMHQAAARGLHDPRVFDNWRPLQNVQHYA
jgi:hypothetical protein